MKRISSPTSYSPTKRGSIAARNTLERPTAALDAHSLICMEWAAHHLAAREKLRPQPAVILRRALDVYVGHLQSLPGTRSELIALESAGRGTGSARMLTEARARLEAAEGRPMAFREVRYSPQQLREQREMLEALERHMEGLQ